MKKLLVPVLFLAATISGCYYDNFEELNAAELLKPCDTSGTMSFAEDIQPILTSRCGTDNSSCHDASNSDPYITGANGSLLNYNGVMEVFIDDGNEDTAAGAARFIARVSHDSIVPTSKWMPLSQPKIESCSILKIRKWIDNGYPNN
jgi:hypothetical protein